MPCWRHSSVVVNPASPCLRIVMICSSLCRVPFNVFSSPGFGRNSHSTWHNFRGLGQVVERTFAWLNQFRRLRVRYEKRADIHEALLVLGSVLICWNFLST